MNTSAVFKNCDWFYEASLLILWGEIITRTFMFEIFLWTTKYVLIISNFRNYTITINFWFPALFTLQLHYVAAMFFIRFGKWDGVRHLAPKKLGESCCTSVISRYFGNIMHTHFSLLKITLLSFFYRVSILITYRLWISVFWGEGVAF